jgi:hypothetical protein
MAAGLKTMARQKMAAGLKTMARQKMAAGLKTMARQKMAARLKTMTRQDTVTGLDTVVRLIAVTWLMPMTGTKAVAAADLMALRRPAVQGDEVYEGAERGPAGGIQEDDPRGESRIHI